MKKYFQLLFDLLFFFFYDYEEPKKKQQNMKQELKHRSIQEIWDELENHPDFITGHLFTWSWVIERLNEELSYSHNQQENYETEKKQLVRITKNEISSEIIDDIVCKSFDFFECGEDKVNVIPEIVRRDEDGNLELLFLD